MRPLLKYIQHPWGKYFRQIQIGHFKIKLEIFYKSLLFFTHRGMAICINLMFARAGGVIGSNVASSLLENQCQVLFGLSSSLLIGKQFMQCQFNATHMFSLPVCACVWTYIKFWMILTQFIYFVSSVRCTIVFHPENSSKNGRYHREKIIWFVDFIAIWVRFK